VTVGTMTYMAYNLPQSLLQAGPAGRIVEGLSRAHAVIACRKEAPMKVAAAVVVVLALVAGLLPQLTDCQSQGRSLTLADGRTVPMKCHWTAQAEIALAGPLAGAGLLLATSRRKAAQRDLGAVAALLGAAVVLVPTVLIGVCAGNEMLCNLLMRPALILTGGLVVAAGLATLLAARERQGEPA
jgi:hypothetical protein